MYLEMEEVESPKTRWSGLRFRDALQRLNCDFGMQFAKPMDQVYFTRSMQVYPWSFLSDRSCCTRLKILSVSVPHVHVRGQGRVINYDYRRVEN